MTGLMGLKTYRHFKILRIDLIERFNWIVCNTGIIQIYDFIFALLLCFAASANNHLFGFPERDVSDDESND